MEKYSQFRDKGSGIAPFLPIPSQPAGAYLAFHVFLFVIRLPLLLSVTAAYFLVLQWLPLGILSKKALLWMILGVPGVWWIDLQIDGVRKGSLAKHHAQRLPQPGDVIASSFTSPVDALYLAAIFDPVFTVSYPHTRQVQRVSLLSAILRAFKKPREHPPPGAPLKDLRAIVENNPTRVVVVFPECTTTNGRAILPFSPSILGAPVGAKIFPISLRYSPSDITTPIPRSYWSFLWNLLSKPTNCIRVRIAECVYNTSKDPARSSNGLVNSYTSNFLDTLQTEDNTLSSSTDTLTGSDDQQPSTEERKILDKVGEALARLGRVKRIGLGVERHVFGRSTRKEQCYDGLRISKNAWDTNLVKANPLYLSVNWEASGGGAFAVIPLEERGRMPEQLPLFRGHTAAVLDTDWSPFNDSFLASASDDGKVFLWKVPQDFSVHTTKDEPEDVQPISKLTGHSRKVGHVLFNPAAENVLATASGDYSVKIWDVEKGAPRLTLKHGDIVQSLSWSANGSLLVTTSRDKKLRIWDVRQERPAKEVPGHTGAKNSRAVWMGEHDRIATTGFSKMSDRQLGLWDIREPKEPVGGFQILDSISGVCMPFWDEGTQCLYLAGKGDGNIRYFEYENDKFEYLSEYKSSDPQRGIAFLPKRGVNTHENEVMRAFKTVNDSYVEPISFIVPRRAEVFQSDIYPPATGAKPGVSLGEWFDGKDALPPKLDLESLYDGGEAVMVPASQKAASSPPAPASPKAPAPTKQEPEEPKPTTEASTATLRGPPPSVQDTKSSISQLASKFADQSDSSDEDEEPSNFDEPAPPTSRSIPAAAGIQPTTAAPAKSQPSPTKDHPSSTNGLSNKPDLPQSNTQKPLTAPSPTINPSSSQSQPSQPTPPSTSTNNQPIQTSLDEIKTLLEHQNRTMSAQNDRIGQLTAELDALKTKLGERRGSSVEKDERIRQLEEEVGRVRG
ncbi:MAG: Coronin-like protein crn1 [Piccolia ochrophora]|nr:MAG: Coronin-like protein crn1 [Piccolia ochrophora]